MAGLKVAIWIVQLLLFPSERTYPAADRLPCRRFCHLIYEMDEYAHVISFFPFILLQIQNKMRSVNLFLNNQACPLFYIPKFGFDGADIINTDQGIIKISAGGEFFQMGVIPRT